MGKLPLYVGCPKVYGDAQSDCMLGIPCEQQPLDYWLHVAVVVRLLEVVVDILPFAVDDIPLAVVVGILHAAAVHSETCEEHSLCHVLFLDLSDSDFDMEDAHGLCWRVVVPL